MFQQAGFLPAETVTVPDRRAVERTIDDVVANVFSSSSTAPHLFGDRQEDFEHDMRKILAQASPSGDSLSGSPTTSCAYGGYQPERVPTVLSRLHYRGLAH